jgi:ubiquinone/menaquinone biosynthesis C-methylase UbiE
VKHSAIDRANARFWDELCGSNLARQLGIRDRTAASLERFDRAYFDMYPYLLPLVQPERLTGRRVLEVGLGYGSLGQKLAAVAAGYAGLDIAAGPVDMMNHRLRMASLQGAALQGSALAMPFPDERFDAVIAIGCFHHTGNLQRCLDETYRVLAPGGFAVVMVYNKFSIRQWLQWPGPTLAAFIDELFKPCPGASAEHEELVATARELIGKLYRSLTQTDTPTTAVGPALQTLLGAFLGHSLDTGLAPERRAAYDANFAGDAAPETVLTSIGDLRRMLERFASVTFSKQNADALALPRRWLVIRGKVLAERDQLLTTLGRLLGLDIYFEAQKGMGQPSRQAA